MRFALFASVALLLGGGNAIAADPPIVFQAQPFGQVLDNVRTALDLMAGEKGVNAFNKELRDALGEKGFEGLDIGRPIFGYVTLAPDPTDITAVLALPITTEKEFLDLCERVNHQKATLFGKEKDIYQLPPLDPQYKALMRFSQQYAYIAYGAKPISSLEPKSLVPIQKIYVPNETGLIVGRLYFDRIPLAVKLALPILLNEVKKTILGGLPFGGGDEPFLKAIMPEVEKLVSRYVKLAGGADEMAARIAIDVPTGNLIVEANLKGKPGSELSKIIADRKPTGNKFSGLIATPDTIVGFKCRLPLFEEEIRAASVAGLEFGQKELMRFPPPDGKPLVEEIFKGLIRTVKTGQFDIVGGVRGPDKNGWYSAVGAIAFEDTANLEKEFKALIEKQAPAEEQEKIKWDAAKAGKVTIHTWKPDLLRLLFVHSKIFGGDDCLVAFAFAPHGIFLVIGPDAVATMKEALAVKPADSTVLDISVNPARARKLFDKLNGEQAGSRWIDAVLGKEDKLNSSLSVTVEGGKELKVSFKIDLRLLPRFMFMRDIERTNKDQEK